MAASIHGGQWCTNDFGWAGNWGGNYAAGDQLYAFCYGIEYGDWTPTGTGWSLIANSDAGSDLAWKGPKLGFRFKAFTRTVVAADFDGDSWNFPPILWSKAATTAYQSILFAIRAGGPVEDITTAWNVPNYVNPVGFAPPMADAAGDLVVLFYAEGERDFPALRPGTNAHVAFGGATDFNGWNVQGAFNGSGYALGMKFLVVDTPGLIFNWAWVPTVQIDTDTEVSVAMSISGASAPPPPPPAPLLVRLPDEAHVAEVRAGATLRPSSRVAG